MFVPLSRLTRRQALKLGAAAAALGSLKPGTSALAAPRAEAFTLALPEHGATRRRHRLADDEVYDAPRRFDLIGLGWRRPAHVHAQVRARRRGGRWSRWAPLHATGDHGPDAASPRAGTDPVWTGDADQFQLRLRGGARGLHARFVRSGPAARAAPPPDPRRLQPPDPRRAGDVHARPVGRRHRGPALRPEHRPGPARVRPPHGQRERLRAGGVGGDRPRHRQVPPQLQRLERHRLQLPRRPVRPDLRGPRGRDRQGDRRRPGAGLQQRLDRRGVARHVHRRAARGRGDRRARPHHRLEARAARGACRGRRHRHVARRRVEPLEAPGPR